MATMTRVNASSVPRLTDIELTASEAARRAIDDYLAPGRSAMIRIRTTGVAWEYGVNSDRPYRAASLLKLGIAIAVEDEIRAGGIHSDAGITVSQLGPRPGG
ncbi:MAG: serine hydrolase, partial [Planctomycetota bacterium]